MFEGISPHWQLYAILPALEPPKEDQDIFFPFAHRRPGLKTFEASEATEVAWTLADGLEGISLPSEHCRRSA